MKFSVLVAIVPEDQEQDCVNAARDLGAGGITVIPGRGISNTAKKTFFGLTYDGCNIDSFTAYNDFAVYKKKDAKEPADCKPQKGVGGFAPFGMILLQI